MIEASEVATPVRTVRLGIEALTLCGAAAIAGAEALVAARELTAGLVVHGLLLFALINAYVLTERRESSEQDRSRRGALLALSIVPLLRITSVALTLPEVGVPYRAAVIGVPLLLAAILTARATAFPAPSFSLRPERTQTLTAAAGLPLSLIAYGIVRPAPLVAEPSVDRFVLAAAIVVLFTGMLEEFIFRGLLQRSLSNMFPQAGAQLGTGIFTATYLGTRSPAYILFVGVAGLLAASIVQRTDRLVGVAVAHALVNVGLLLVWPLVIG
jgi:membrane protease YdiL (CAAX protease family)